MRPPLPTRTPRALRRKRARQTGGRSADRQPPGSQLVAVKVMRIEKMATSRAYQDYIKECNILHKARRVAAQRP